MMGRDAPEFGMVRRSCNGTGRPGDVRVMGAMDIVGFPALTGSLLERPIRACSRRESEVDCMVSSLVVVLVDKRFALLVVEYEDCTSEMYGNPIKVELIIQLNVGYTQLHSHFICPIPRPRPRRSMPHRANLANLKSQTPNAVTSELPTKL